MTEVRERKVYDIPCQRCGHVTMRYHGPAPLKKDPTERLLKRLKYLDETQVKPSDLAVCPECNEDHLPETFLPKNWQEYKDHDPAARHLPTHGHKKDSVFAKTTDHGRLRV
jgi:hypothetical protein